MKVTLLTLAFGFFLVVGLPLAATAGPTPGGADSDSDTVEDGFDNCTTKSNPGQEDSDHDGCGDVCDPPITCDIDNSGGVGGGDYNLVVGYWGWTVYPCVPLYDCDNSGGCGGGDYNLVVQQWGWATGPSGVTNPNRDYTECP